MLDGIAVRGEDGIDRDLVAFRAGAGLDADGGFVVVARNGAVGAFEDEAALGLGLVGPGIGEGAPAGFAFAEAEAVAEFCCRSDNAFVAVLSFGSGDFMAEAGARKMAPEAMASMALRGVGFTVLITRFQLGSEQQKPKPDFSLSCVATVADAHPAAW